MNSLENTMAFQNAKEKKITLWWDWWKKEYIYLFVALTHTGERLYYSQILLFYSTRIDFWGTISTSYQ